MQQGLIMASESSGNSEQRAERDPMGDLLDRGASLARRVGLRGLSRDLWARSAKRFTESYHRGARDDEENDRTSPPVDERIEVHSVWMVEVFPPSLSIRLGRALGRLPSGGIYRRPGEDLAEEVARARRHPLGGWWWNLGVLNNRALGPRPGGSTIELPDAVDHLFLTMYLMAPSLACVVGQFVLTDQAASRIDAILRARYSTEGVRQRDGSVLTRSPLTSKRELVAGELDHLHDACKSWFGVTIPGAFCDGLLEDHLPTCYFMTLDKVRPLTDEARLEYLDPVGINMGYSALASKNLPGLRLSEPTGVSRRSHTFYLAGKRDELFPNDDSLGGHGRGRGGFTVALHMRLNRFIAMWGLERTLLGYEMAFGRLRDSFSSTHPTSTRKNLAALSEAGINIATLGGDALAVARDAQRLTDNERAFGHELVTFEPVQREMWRFEGTWTDVMRNDIRASAQRVAEAEASTRDLELTRASIISSRTNLALQSSLRWLTILLVVLTIALVAIGFATLGAMD
jgi:hypothetical protein